MPTMKQMLGLTAALVLASAVQAQTQENLASYNAGLLGSRAISTGFQYGDLNHSKTDIFATGLRVNVPILSNVDVSAAYGYEWLEGRNKYDSHSLQVAGTYYIAEGAFKPFGTVGLGYVWPSYPGLNLDDRFTYQVRAGLEWLPSQKIAVTASVGYDDDFKSGDNGVWDGSLGLNYAFSSKIVGTLEIAYLEGGDFLYSAGVTYRF